MTEWWLALVAFERRNTKFAEFLPEHCQGATGWMACHALNEIAATELIAASLSEVGLRLLEVSKHIRTSSQQEIFEIDEHLAANIIALEPGKTVAWGTIYPYVGDGTA